MSRTRTGRRALSIALTAALAGTAFFTLQGTSNAAPGTTGTAAPTEGTVAGGGVITVTGSGFKDAAGILNVKTVGVGYARLVATASSCTDANTLAAGAGANFTYSVVSATKITAKLPAHAAGAVKLCLPVVGTAQTHTANAYVTVPFTYAAQPSAGTLDHATGPAYGGQTVVATSTAAWRAGSTAVTVGGIAASNVRVASGGASLSFVTPSGAVTGSTVNVVVKTLGFAAVTAGTYTYESALRVAPAVVDPAGGTITITGAGFTDPVLYPTNVGVWANDGSGAAPLCGNIAIVSDTEITCDLAAHAAAAVSIVVGDDTDGTLANATAGSTSVVTSASTVTFASY